MKTLKITLWNNVEGLTERFLNQIGLTNALAFYREAGYTLVEIAPVF